MFNMSLAVKFSMVMQDFPTKELAKIFLDSNCSEKIIISIDKVVYKFEDTSLLCCDGNDVKARPAGADISEFTH